MSPEHCVSLFCRCRNGLQTCRVAETIPNKQLRTLDEGCSSSLESGHGDISFSPENLCCKMSQRLSDFNAFVAVMRSRFCEGFCEDSNEHSSPITPGNVLASWEIFTSSRTILYLGVITTTLWRWAKRPSPDRNSNPEPPEHGVLIVNSDVQFVARQHSATIVYSVCVSCC
jgi:hypothetical protein